MITVYSRGTERSGLFVGNYKIISYYNNNKKDEREEACTGVLPDRQTDRQTKDTTTVTLSTCVWSE